MTEQYRKGLVETFLCVYESIIDGLQAQNRRNALHNGYGIICNERKTVSSTYFPSLLPLSLLWALNLSSDQLASSSSSVAWPGGRPVNKAVGPGCLPRHPPHSAPTSCRDGQWSALNKRKDPCA